MSHGTMARCLATASPSDADSPAGWHPRQRTPDTARRDHAHGDPHETSPETAPDILNLRELHAAMDRAVLEAYGWHDLADTATCEFLLDYEDDEDELSVVSSPLSVAGGGHGAALAVHDEQRTSRRKNPRRYRWPDDFRDEVIARLLALNKERAEQERLSGQAAAAAETGKAKPKAAKKPRRKKSDGNKELPFGE